MSQLCFLTNLTSSDVAAWAQAVVSAIAIIVGACAVNWQTRRARLEQCEREARVLNGLVRLLTHLKDSAQDARAERKKFHRWPIGHPAEPSTRFQELAEAIRRFPLEAAQGEVPLEALLNARRVAKEIQFAVGPEPELDVNPDFEHIFHEYTAILDQQILLLQVEAQRLMKGERPRYAAATSN